jgi:hypothetical protein
MAAARRVVDGRGYLDDCGREAMNEETKAISDALGKPFPPEAIKKRQGGAGKMLDYLDGATVIRRLNEATGNNWSFHVTRLEWHGELLMATGELTIPGMGTRTGIGVQKVSERGGEDLVKGAATDSLKKSASLFGVGLQLYGDDIEAQVEAKEEAKARSQRPKMQISTAQQQELTQAVMNGGGDVVSAPFQGWLSKNTANGATTLADVLAEDFDGVLGKLNALAEKRKAAAS